MSDVTRVLEDIRDKVSAGPGAFDRLAHRRRIRQVRRRAATIAFALLLAVLAVGGAVRVFESSRPIPADRIDRSTIREVRPVWRSSIGDPAVGHEVGGHHGHTLAVEPFAPVAVGDDVVTLTSRGRLVAFPMSCSESPCAPSWIASAPDPAFGPVVAGGRVIVPTADGRLYAFAPCGSDGAACDPAWIAPTSDAGAGPAGPPIAVGSAVFGVLTDGTVYAFDANCRPVSGICEPAWRTHMSVSADVGHLTSPVAGDGLVFTTNDLDRVYAFDPATGRTVWSAVVERPEGGYPLPDTLAVAGGKVFATFSNGLYAFPVNCSGRCAPAWHATAPTPDGIMSSAVVDSGLVLVKTWASPTAGHVLAFDPDCRSDGGACEPTWSAIDHGWGDVVAAEGVVYSTSYVDGSVDAFSVTCAQASSCDPVWEAGNLGTPVSGPAYPSARNGLLFVPTEAGVLHVLPSSCPSTCEPVRSFAPNLDARERTRSLSPPLIVGGRMWFVSEDGHLFGYSVGAR